jgi:hypothetical protein
MSPVCVIGGGWSGLYSRRFAGERSRTRAIPLVGDGTPHSTAGQEGQMSSTQFMA